MADVSAMVETAVRHHQTGRIEQADLMYREILREHPEHPVALHSLGALAYRRGQYDEAADLLYSRKVYLPRRFLIGFRHTRMHRRRCAASSAPNASPVLTDLLILLWPLW